jgi:hypothetical protein
MRCEDRTCQGPTGGAGSKEDWRTCNGEPWGWSTVAHVVWVEDANDCAFTTNVIANSPAEALQCARNNHGENAIDTPIETMMFAVTCPTTGCNQQTRNGRDQDAMESCLEYEFPNCEIEAGPCQ